MKTYTSPLFLQISCLDFFLTPAPGVSLSLFVGTFVFRTPCLSRSAPPTVCFIPPSADDVGSAEGVPPDASPTLGLGVEGVGAV